MSPLPETLSHRSHALVVVESGCDRLAWRRALSSAGVSAETVVQRPGEAPSAHVGRAIAALDSSVSRLFVVAGPRIDTDSLDARSQLLRAFAETDGAERRSIQLEGSGAARFLMEALSEMASEQLRASGIRVLGPSVEPDRRIAA